MQPNELPWPIACPLAIALDPSQGPLRRLEHLLFAYNQYLRVVSLGLLSQYLHQDVVIPPMERSLRALRTPHIGDWLTVINTAVKHFPASGLTPCFPTLREDLKAVPKVPVVWPGQTSGGETQHPLEFLREVRNRLWGHSVPLSNESLEEVTPHYLEAFRALLAGSTFLSECSLFQRLDPPEESDLSFLDDSDPAQYILLRGTTPTLVPATPLLAPYSSDPGRSALFLRTSVGDWPLYPLFVGHGAQGLGAGEPLLLFDGYNRKRIAYVGVTAREDSESDFSYYETLLAQKNVDLRLKLEEVGVPGLAALAGFWTSTRLSEMTGTKYLPQVYQPRKGADGLLERFLEQREKPAILLTGTTGTGKSSLLCRCSDELLVRGGDDVVLLVPGHSFRASEAGATDPFLVFRDAFGLAPDVGSMQALLTVLHSRRTPGSESRLIILVDAANESEVPRLLLAWLDDFAAAAKPLGWVRLVVTYREEAWKSLLDHEAQHEALTPALAHRDCWYSSQGEPACPLPSFSADEVREAYERYGTVKTSVWEGTLPPWNSLEANLQELLAVPLHLQLFCRLDPARSAEIRDQAGLHAAFARTMVATLRDPSVLEAILDECLATGSALLSPERVSRERERFNARYGGNPAALCAYLDPIETLLDRGLLVRTEQEGEVYVQFAHQAILEALLVDLLHRRDLTGVSAEPVLAVLEVPKPLPEGLNAVGWCLAADLLTQKGLNRFQALELRVEVLAVPVACALARSPSGTDQSLTTRIRALLESSPLWLAAVLPIAEAMFAVRRAELAGRIAALDPQPASAELQATCLYFLDQVEPSLEALDRALEGYVAAGDLKGAARCRMRRSYTAYYLRRHAQAAEDFGLAMTAFRTGGWTRELAFLLKNAGSMREGDEAVPLIDEACRLFDDLGERAMAGSARVNLSVELSIAGKFERAAEEAQRGLSLLEEAGEKTRLGAPHNNRGLALLALGDAAGALMSFQAAAVLCFDGWERSGVENNLAATWAALGNAERAEEHLGRAELYVEQSGDPSVRARLALTRLGSRTPESPNDGLALYRSAEQGFLASLDLRGLAITLGFARRMGQPEGALLAAIGSRYGGDFEPLARLTYFPWHIVLFE